MTTTQEPFFDPASSHSHPSHKTTTEPPNHAPPSPFTPMHTSQTVLLIEDNPAHVRLIRRCLQMGEIHCDVQHVSDGEQGLDYLFRRGSYIDPHNSPTPSLILLDLRLPKIDGFGVLKTLKEHEDLRQIPVVVLTTSDADNDIRRAYSLHTNSYLVKPAEIQKLRDLLQSTGLYWLLHNQHSTHAAAL